MEYGPLTARAVSSPMSTWVKKLSSAGTRSKGIAVPKRTIASTRYGEKALALRPNSLSRGKMPRSTGGADQVATPKPHRPISPYGHCPFPGPTCLHHLPTGWAWGPFGPAAGCFTLGSHRYLLLNQLRPERIQSVLHGGFDLRKRGAWMLTTPVLHGREHLLA